MPHFYAKLEQRSDVTTFLFKKDQGLRIENHRMLAVAFAKTVTAKTTVGNGWIARKGEATLFRALRDILPQVKEIDSFVSNYIPASRRTVAKHEISI